VEGCGNVVACVAMKSEQECYVAALRILHYRFNSVVELRRKLSAKAFERETIDITIARLSAEKWLDDERFAGVFVRARALKNIGPQRIRRELLAAGVADDIARRAVGENLEPEREREGVTTLCEKKMRIIARRDGAAYLHTDEGRKKLAAYLLNHGYEASLVFDTIDQCMKVRSA
jgi:regulatory protein